MYSKEELTNDFRKLGVRAAGTVMLQLRCGRLEKLLVVRLHTASPQNGEWVPSMARYLSARELFDFVLSLMKAVAADPLAAESLKERSGHSLPADGRQT
jgi:hypothetical protein